MQPTSSIAGHVPDQSATQAASPRLIRAAHEFEAQMMKELLKPMNSADPLTGEDSDTGSSGALGDFAAESLGRALSAHGGLGIANRIIHDLNARSGIRSGRDLTGSGNNSDPAAVTAKVHGNTG